MTGARWKVGSTTLAVAVTGAPGIIEKVCVAAGAGVATLVGSVPPQALNTAALKLKISTRAGARSRELICLMVILCECIAMRATLKTMGTVPIGNPATSFREAGGFASPPHGRFALVLTSRGVC
jgi:hypothetical protein